VNCVVLPEAQGANNIRPTLGISAAHAGLVPRIRELNA
jgi:hypothetical protein